MYESCLLCMRHVSCVCVMSPIYESCRLDQSSTARLLYISNTHATKVTHAQIYNYHTIHMRACVSTTIDSHLHEPPTTPTHRIIYCIYIYCIFHIHFMLHITYVSLLLHTYTTLAASSILTCIQIYRETRLIHRRHDSNIGDMTYTLETRLIHRRHDSYIGDMTHT